LEIKEKKKDIPFFEDGHDGPTLIPISLYSCDAIVVTPDCARVMHEHG
jgi:hypothetical protein